MLGLASSHYTLHRGYHQMIGDLKSMLLEVCSGSLLTEVTVLISPLDYGIL